MTVPPSALPAPRREVRAETILCFPESPIYSSLAAAWRAAGRTVPGLPDPAWDVLVGRRRHHPAGPPDTSRPPGR
ncbi:hypothetical protein OG871_32520 [Kitasatospora sp. NBC_00374]|uniref:hypothetical protein n=1 Tax=Kitasatospora sp. NBC_00374 TaxID=2975964 RepID=UPI00324BE3C0